VAGGEINLAPQALEERLPAVASLIRPAVDLGIQEPVCRAEAKVRPVLDVPARNAVRLGEL